jgi:hypothetical protein
VSKRIVRPPFSYDGSRFRDATAVLDTIRTWPHPNDILVDSSFFSPSRLDLNRQLLLERNALVLPDVEKELNDLRSSADAPREQLKELLFEASGALNSKLIRGMPSWIRGREYPVSRYANMLHLRKRILEEQEAAFERKHGRIPKGRERSLIHRNLLTMGISQRTLSLAIKGDAKRRYADEVLAVVGVLHPILTGRDVFILTADRDVFEQVFQLTQLLHDDYGSFLVGRDFAAHPDRYPHRHPASTVFMKPGAIAIGRPSEPEYLLPSIFETCAVGIVDVRSCEFLFWVPLREVDQMLAFQATSADGRVGDGGDGASIHMSLHGGGCSLESAHFTIGKDEVAVESNGIRLSRWDVQRAFSNKRLPIAPGGRVLMRGLSR